jgi:hypothetical protein
MSERYGSPYDNTAHKWLALIERRQQNFIELWQTGRWQHYYTHAQFKDEMRKVLDLRNHWARLAGVSLAGVSPSEQINMPGSSKQADPLRPQTGLGDAAPPPSARSGPQRTSAVLLAAVPAPL